MLAMQLYIYDVATKYWTERFPSGTELIPALALHTASIDGAYMMVYGGSRHTHESDEQCFSDSVLLYNFACNDWSLSKVVSETGRLRGRYSHASITKPGNTTMVFGGFSGIFNGGVEYLSQTDVCGSDRRRRAKSDVPLSPLLDAAVPSSAPSTTACYQQQSCPNICERQTSCQSCTTDPSCSWCPGSVECIASNGVCSNTSEALPAIANVYSCGRPSHGFASRSWMSKYSFVTDASPNVYELLPSSKSTRTTGTFVHQTVQGVVTIPKTGSYEFRIDGNGTARSRISWEEPNVTASTTSYRDIFLDRPVVISNVTRIETLKAGTKLNVNMRYESISSKGIDRPVDIAMLWRSSNGSWSAIPGALSSPGLAANCRSRRTCGDCASAGCVWCLEQNTSEKSAVWPGHAFCQQPEDIHQCARVSAGPADCTDCTDFVDCKTCLDSKLPCDWHTGANGCVENRSYPILAILNEIETAMALNTSEMNQTNTSNVSTAIGSDSCPAQCSQLTSCSTCLDSNNCGWCASTQTCFDFAEYTLANAFGQCRSWIKSGEAGAKCPDCSDNTDCDSCFMSAECGWCYAPENVDRGVCLQGDVDHFLENGTYVSASQSTCSVYRMEVTTRNASDDVLKNTPSCNATTTTTTVAPALPAFDVNRTCVEGNTTVSTSFSKGMWVYDRCPDKDECAMGRDLCSPNSTCTNVNPGEYTCTCIDQYHTDISRKDAGRSSNPCVPDCCDHATCALPYLCVCEPGWTGPTCTVNCGCNQHGDCLIDNTTTTMAPFTAAPNTTTTVGTTTTVQFGPVQPDNATTAAVASTTAVSTTTTIAPQAYTCGKCHHNTTGPRCEFCAPGFYGDPKLGGQCKPCNCRGHGDPARDYCDRDTGVCHCMDFTTGKTCNKCLHGLWNFNDRCYVECGFSSTDTGDDGWNWRKKLTVRNAGIVTGPLDTKRVKSMCMWLIEAPSPNYTITLNFEALNTECHYDYVHIFDSDYPQNSHALGAYVSRLLCLNSI